MRVSRRLGLGTKALPHSHAPWVLVVCEGVDCPSLPRPLLPGFCSLFLAVNYAKGGWQRKGKWGLHGRSLKDWGAGWGETGPVRTEPSQYPPLHPVPMLSHGVLEKGAGWLDWFARPWG